MCTPDSFVALSPCSQFPWRCRGMCLYVILSISNPVLPLVVTLLTLFAHLLFIILCSTLVRTSLVHLHPLSSFSHSHSHSLSFFLYLTLATIFIQFRSKSFSCLSRCVVVYEKSLNAFFLQLPLCGMLPYAGCLQHPATCWFAFSDKLKQPFNCSSCCSSFTSPFSHCCPFPVYVILWSMMAIGEYLWVLSQTSVN